VPQLARKLSASPATHADFAEEDRLPLPALLVDVVEMRVGDQETLRAKRDQAGIAARIRMRVLRHDRDQLDRVGPLISLAVRAEPELHSRTPRADCEDPVLQFQQLRPFSTLRTSHHSGFRGLW